MLGLISTVHAQTAQSGAPQGSFMSFVPLIVIFFIFYFLMIRPQKKKMEEEQKFLTNLQKGDEVFTKSGIIGTVYGITDKIITLEINDSTKIKVLKHYVGGLAKEALEPVKKAK